MATRHTFWAWGLAAVTALALTGWLYARPEMAIVLAEQLWSCFGL